MGLAVRVIMVVAATIRDYSLSCSSRFLKCTNEAADRRKFAAANVHFVALCVCVWGGGCKNGRNF